MTANEQTLDLFKLYVAVRNKGGYDAVSRNDLWDLVANESGLESLTSIVKVLYRKYLSILERLLENIAEDKDFRRNRNVTDFSENVIELQAGLNGFVADAEYMKKNDELHGNTKLMHKLNFPDHDNEDVNLAGCGVDVHNTDDLSKSEEDSSLKLTSNVDKISVDIENLCSLHVQELGNVSKNAVEMSVGFSNGGRKYDDHDPDIKEGKILDSTSTERQNHIHTRNNECALRIVNWITRIAKNPCDPLIGSLLEMSKWNSCVNEEVWKQVLLFREAMLLKRRLRAVKSTPQKIHPSMFDDHQSSSYDLRDRFKYRKVLPPGKSISSDLAEMSGSSSLMLGVELDYDQREGEMAVTTDSLMPEYMGECAFKEVPLGPKFQVEVAEWSSTVFESDSKWLGTVVWPSDKANQTSLMECDLIGEGRQDSCDCRVPGSTKCIKHHIAEKRYKVKMELGSLYDEWKFDFNGKRSKKLNKKKGRMDFKTL